MAPATLTLIQLSRSPIFPRVPPQGTVAVVDGYRMKRRLGMRAKEGL